jgi:type IV fimbrial biogenesis protein FimT
MYLDFTMCNKLCTGFRWDVMDTMLRIARTQGFTLIELLVTLTVLAILTGLATPSFLGMVRDNRLVTQTNELLGALHLARSEAVKRNRDVGVCKSSDGASCDNGASWEDGWIVWVDEDASGDHDAGEPVLRVAGELSAGNRIYPTADLADRLVYSNRGFASAIGSWQFCDTRGAAHASNVVLNPSGRPKISDKLHDGGAPACL